MYIIVNKDLKMSKGKMSAQVSHVVNILIYRMARSEDAKVQDLLEEYMSGEIKKIILYGSEELLLELEKESKISIRDKGYTEIPPNSLTCVAYALCEKDEVDERISSLKLV